MTESLPADKKPVVTGSSYGEALHSESLGVACGQHVPRFSAVWSMQKLRCWLQLWAMALVLTCCARARDHRTCPSPSTKCKCLTVERKRDPWITCHQATASGKIPKFKELPGRPVRYRSINLIGLNITRVQSNAFAYLKVSDILLDENPLEGGIAKDAFNGLENVLRVLELAKSKLKYIPGSAIKRLTALKKLNLENCTIKEVKRSDFNFKRKSKLQVLNLSYNSIHVLKKAVFSSLKNLRYLYLNRNLIQAISRSTFRGLRKLTTLDLSGNAIKTLRRGIFREMKNLLKLDLTENYIESLPSGVFQRLDKLVYLDLRSNHIKALERRSFNGLDKLQALDVRDNPISVIVEGTFMATGTLRLLLLNAYGVVSWSRKTFKGASNVTNIHLGRVNWTTIPHRLFEPVDKLTKLNFHDVSNRFENFPLSSLSSKTDMAKLRIFVTRTRNKKCDLDWVQKLLQKRVQVSFMTYHKHDNYKRCFDRSKALADG